MYKIFEQLSKARNVSPYFVSKETGINFSTISSWKNGKYHPKDDKLKIIADFFGVPLAYLKGQEEEMQCPECHMFYNPVDEKSFQKHKEYHRHFLDTQKHYCITIPSREEIEQRRVDALMILRDIKYDKFRRISAFNTYAKNDFLLHLYDNDFDTGEDLDQHSRMLAEKLRPDKSISLDLCNAIRAEFNVDEYEQDLSANITEREYKIICKYRKLSEDVAAAVDRILEV